MVAVLFLLYLFQNIIPQHGQEINFNVSKDVTDYIDLYYYKGPNFDDQVVLKLKDGLSLTEQENFQINSSTIFFFHGWGENATIGSAEDVVTAFLDMKIRNVVAFDYSKLVRNNGKIVNYLISVFNASHIGQAIGEFFKGYIPDKQPLNLVKLVSHSLGSQIMAKTARTFGIGKLARLTALDPAGPLYNIPGIKHLDAKDGKFVDVIHTDGGFFGDGRTIGTVDFFPNRGTRDQPGCYESLQNITSSCSHSRSHEYYAESIRNPKAFLAKKCKRTILFQHCCCNNTDLAYMGYYVNTGIHGTYFLKTNDDEPFGEGVNAFCSHKRSHQYYAESIRNPKAFLAKKCQRIILFQHCCCNNTDLAYMGYYVNTGIHGTYFLKTNDEEPFGEGVNGTNLK